MQDQYVIVDDDRQETSDFSEHVTARGGVCHVFSTCEEAAKGIPKMWQQLRGIVLDLGFYGDPHKGAGLATFLRTNGGTTPIIILTQDVSSTTELALRRECADEYLRKRDRSYSVILTMIDKIWERRGHKGTRIELGGLSYDTATRIVTYRGKSRETPLDEAVGRGLAVLLESPREEVTYEQISDASGNGAIESIKAQKIVSTLRIVLDELGLKNAIRTIRNVGYVLENFD